MPVATRISILAVRRRPAMPIGWREQRRRICLASPAGGGLTGLLDPKQIVGPNYFGNTSHKKGDMVDFVTGTIHAGKGWDKEQVESVVAGAIGRGHAASASKRPTMTINPKSKPVRR